MNNFNRMAIAVVVCISVFTLGKMSRADGGPLPSIHSLIQQGEGVDVKLRLFGPTARNLMRQGENDEEWVQVFENHHFDVDDALSAEVSCWEYPGMDCEEFPEDCGDCDDDGVIECAGECITTYLFIYFDECVVPGTTEYGLLNNIEIPTDTRTVEVEDVGQECADESDADSDDDSDDDDSHDDGESSSDLDDISESDCSVTQVGSNSNVSSLSPAILGLLGTLLLLVRL